MSNPNITYVVTIGPDDREFQALYLINSIRKFDKDAQIISFLVEEEKEDIETDVLDEIEEKTSLISGKMPNPDYPLSASHQALVEAGKKSKDDYLLSIDTDTVILDPIRIHKDSEAELMMKPADLSFLSWQSEESQTDWEELSQKTGLDIPELDSMNSTVDGGRMREYYNGGFILTKNNDFPKRWKAVSERIYQETQNFFSEQIALAFLSQEYETEALDERYNSPVPMRYRVPRDTKVLHYHHKGYYHFYKYRNQKWLFDKLEGTGIIERYRQEKKKKGFYRKVAKSYLSGLKRFKIGRIIEKKMKKYNLR